MTSLYLIKRKLINVFSSEKTVFPLWKFGDSTSGYHAEAKSAPGIEGSIFNHPQHDKDKISFVIVDQNKKEILGGIITGGGAQMGENIGSSSQHQSRCNYEKDGGGGGGVIIQQELHVCMVQVCMYIMAHGPYLNMILGFGVPHPLPPPPKKKVQCK